MAIRRTTLALLLAALAALGVAAFLAGCEKTPSAPVFDNAFDPQGPDGGTPMYLTATINGANIRLSWTQPQGYGIATYEISHSLDRFSGYLPVGTVDASTSTFGTFVYEDASPTTIHYFKIQAYDAVGNFTNISDQTPASRTTPPLVVAGDGTGLVASRQVTLNVMVSAGDSLRVSNSRDFATETRLAAGEPGETLEIPWTLPQVDSNDTTLTVWVLATPLVAATDTAQVVLDVEFLPDFMVAGDPATVATRLVELEIPADGVDAMRFAATEEGLAAESWLPGAAVHSYQLFNSANPQNVWAEFEGDFGFNVTGSISVTPDLLIEATFALDLPADRLTDQSTVTILADAAATQMRFSENLEFGSVAWTAYADTSSLELSPGAGRKVIYGQFRNDWAQSAILTDYVIYLSQPLEVAILAPGDGSLITSGTALEILGTSTAPDFSAQVDSVRFDTGDGDGFRRVTGLESWSYLWDVPTVTEDAETVLRARAWADGDSVTTSVTVTIQAEGGK